MIYRTKGHSPVAMMVYGLVEILNGLVRILSLGLLGASFDFDYISWVTKRQLERKIEQEKNSTG